MTRKFQIGNFVRKIKGSQWQGHVCGTYSTSLTPEGYAVESDAHPGSVQIYPAAALELVPLEMVKKRTAEWYSGPPPSIGWWPASVTRDPKALRWWNGEHWSLACYRGMDLRQITRYSALKTENKFIYWTWRPSGWPRRSRT